jgi:dihydropteroate synthase
VADGLNPGAPEAMALAAREHGVACLTGEGWVLLAGHVSQLAGMARPGHSPLDPKGTDSLADAIRGLAERPMVWETARGEIPLDRPVVVGVLNLTPDSFSDGGEHLEPADALRHAESMVASGAGMLDVGAESTRPGRPRPVSVEEEWSRLEAVIPELVRRLPETPLSIDTVKSQVAQRALDAGAWVVNDVGGLRLDPAIGDVCAAAGAGLVLMHSRGSLSEMATYDHASYDDVTGEVISELRSAIRRAESRGVHLGRLALDPGLGFAKRPEHNYTILNHLSALVALGFPVMVGPSRKRFLGAVTGKGPRERDVATAAACVGAYGAGVRLFRVHAVAEVREALDIAHEVGSR